MISMTLAEVAYAVQGSLADAPEPDAEVTGPVVVDSREVQPGGLFVAVPGERVDGHEFAAAAVASGAAGVLATRSVGVPAVVVDDTVAALGRLAHAVAEHLTYTQVIGITGSSGKTTTKDLLAQLLGAVGPTVAPPGSYNNEIGFPLTVLRAGSDTAFLVLELGARGKGHIAGLATIATPQVGLVLNVGSAHLGEFGSREAIAEAKGELVEALPRDGVACLNGDDELVRGMASRTSARVVRFGVDASDADVRAEDITLDTGARPAFSLVTPTGTARVRLGLHGEHQVVNALAAATAAIEIGLSVDEVAAGLSAAQSRSRWRMEVRERPDGVTVVNDAYNANPASAAAALRTLMTIAGGRRTVAVLGEMLELGATAGAEHERLGGIAAELGVDVVLAVGEGAHGVVAGANATRGWMGHVAAVADGASAEEALAEELRPGDVVLFKSSRDAGLRYVGDRVAVAAGPPTPDSGGAA
ncbi:MAG: UDP-N-acetylmuramoyl-tripeptide--D-alanyl-D-alanine ligase [Streptosporangiales bacterium]